MTNLLLSIILAMVISGYLEFNGNTLIFLSVSIVVSSIIFLNEMYIWKKCNRKIILKVVLSFVFFWGGCFYQIAYQNFMSYKAKTFINENKTHFIATIVSSPSYYYNKSYFTVKTKNNVKIYVNYDGENEFSVGQIIKLENPKSFVVNKDNINVKANMRNLGNSIFAIAYATSSNTKIVGFDNNYILMNKISDLRKIVFRTHLKYLPYDHAALICAMSSSQKGMISQEFTDNLIKTGTLHIISVSGMHFFYIYFSTLFVLSFFTKSHRKKLIISFLVSIFFTFYADMGIPVLRAFFMFGAVSIGDLLLIKNKSKKTIFIFTTFIFLIFSPTLVYNISFLLSFGCTFGLVFFTAQISKRLYWIPQIIKGYLSTFFAVGVTSFPLILAIYGRITLTGVFANLLVEMCVPLMLLFSVVLMIISPLSYGLTYAFSMVFELVTDYFMFVINFLGNLGDIQIYSAGFNLICAIMFVVCFVSLARFIFLFKKGKIYLSLIFVLSAFMLGIFIFEINNDNNTYVTFSGDCDFNITVITNKMKHVVIGNFEDIYYSLSTNALKQNEEISLLILQDIKDVDKLKEFKEKYNIKTIILPKKLQDDTIDGIVIKGEQTFQFNDLKITVCADEKEIVRTEIKDENLIVTANMAYVTDDLLKDKNKTVILNKVTKFYDQKLLRETKIPETIKIYSDFTYENNIQKMFTCDKITLK